MTTKPGSLRVDVYFDVLCPWSFIAKRRLERSLSAIPDIDRVDVVWRSFELSPGNRRTPGPTAAEAMTEWWGDQTAARIDLIRRLGTAEGLDLDLHRARPVSSFDAHRLFQFAAAHGRSHQMLEHLLTAYHTDGLNIADHAVLERLSTSAGLQTNDVRTLLAGDAFTNAVRADEKKAAERGVTGVPSLVIGTGPPHSAVQPPQHLTRLLKEGLQVPTPRELQTQRGPLGPAHAQRTRPPQPPHQPRNNLNACDRVRRQVSSLRET